MLQYLKIRGIKIKKRVKFSILIILILIISITSSAFDIISPFLPQQNQMQVESIKLNVSELKLADKINGISINTSKNKIYLNHYKMFKDIEFEKIDRNLSKSMKSGNFDPVLAGVILNNTKYAIELAICDEETDSCVFRINGVYTKKINKSTSFNFNDHKLKVKSVRYNYCDNRMFCDSHFEAYDVVEVEVLERDEI